ncbi:hypothetical protein [Streptomyces sp. NPDC002990]
MCRAQPRNRASRAASSTKSCWPGASSTPTMTGFTRHLPSTEKPSPRPAATRYPGPEPPQRPGRGRCVSLCPPARPCGAHRRPHGGAAGAFHAAGLRHYRQTADALAQARNSWLERLLTRRVALDRAADAFEHQRDDVQVVIDL